MSIQSMSTIRRDFLASYLRSQLDRLRSILGDIEQEKVDCDYANESLRQVEAGLRKIRRLCVNN